MLGHRVHKRVAGLGVLHEKTSNSGREWAEVTGGVEHHCYGNESQAGQNTHQDAVFDEGPGVHLFSMTLVIAKCQDLVADKDQQWTHLLKRPQRLPSYHWDLNGTSRADDVEKRICLVGTTGEAAQQHQHYGVDPDHVEHEDVAPPCRHHVDV